MLLYYVQHEINKSYVLHLELYLRIVFLQGMSGQLSLSRNSSGFFQLVELKNGETYNGHLVSCDNWMNINLREVICTSRVRGISFELLKITQVHGESFEIKQKLGRTTLFFVIIVLQKYCRNVAPAVMKRIIFFMK